MKTFNEIQKEIENTYKLINKKKEKLDQLIYTYSSILKFYFYICFDLLLIGLFLGLSNIILPLIYK